jgi:predicted Rossmann fold flavoprotein
MFPVTDSSQTIIDCFNALANRYNIQIRTSSEVQSIQEGKGSFALLVNGERIIAPKVLIATGGSPKNESYNWLRNLNLKIIPPVPSLFTFNDPGKSFQDLMGISVPGAEVKIVGTKFLQAGPLLITHWGLSGPAVIKLSSWAAEHLAFINYDFNVLVSWIGSVKENDVRNQLLEYQQIHKKQKVISNPLYNLPQRLWTRLCDLAQIEENKIWNELPLRNMNKLLESLIRCPFAIKGKTTFKEEFVTCGGIDLSEIDLERMESKKIKNLFFAGEVLNIDGETGGFNFQAAWTTSYVAASSIAK